MNFSDWFAMLRAYAHRQEGQTMAEYGVVLAVITVIVAATLVLLSGAINTKLQDVIGILS
jgi:Flp pilus assembly pilin Flp